MLSVVIPHNNNLVPEEQLAGYLRLAVKFPYQLFKVDKMVSHSSLLELVTKEH